MKVFSPKKLAEVLSGEGVNNAGIAREAKIDYASLWGIKTGRTEPKINTLLAISFALKKPIDYFLEEEDLQQKLPLADISPKPRRKRKNLAS